MQTESGTLLQIPGFDLSEEGSNQRTVDMRLSSRTAAALSGSGHPLKISEVSQNHPGREFRGDNSRTAGAFGNAALPAIAGRISHGIPLTILPAIDPI
jgi:hypothetical protein